MAHPKAKGVHSKIS